MNIDDKTIFVTDESGVEVEMEVLFTFVNEANGNNIVCFFDPNDETGEVYASIFDDEGNLTPVEDPKEWEVIQEVFDAFVQEEDEATH